MLSKNELIKYNNMMLNITIFDEKEPNKMVKDFQGYNISDYNIMKNLLFLPKELLTDNDYYTMSATFTTYQNKQLDFIKKEIEETNKHYRELLGIPEETVIKERTKLKGRNKDYIPKEYAYLFTKNPEIHYIDFDPIRNEVVLDFDNDTQLLRRLKHELSAKWLPHKTDDNKTIFYLKVKIEYLPLLIEKMKNATKSKHFEPDIKLFNFISIFDIELENAQAQFDAEQKRIKEEYEQKLKENRKAEIKKQLKDLQHELEELNKLEKEKQAK